MKIYIVIVEDRHADVEVRPFSDSDTAITEARRVAESSARGFDIEEVDCSRVDNWLFCAEYSCEGDRVTVAVSDLDNGI